MPERKNVRGAISAFEAAFGVDRTDVQLLIKVSNLDSHNEFSDFLMEKAATNPSIKLMSRYLDRQHIFELLQLIDCFVSLHRSEGFGLGIAEAMLLAKPVISTNWSGNEDFCNPENSLPVDYDLITLDADHGPYKRGQTWADPSVSHAASLMQRVLDDREAATHVGRKAARDIGEMLSPEHIGQLLRNRLDEVHARLNAG